MRSKLSPCLRQHHSACLGSEQTFKGAGIGFWVGVVVYIIAFILNVTAVSIAIEKTG